MARYSVATTKDNLSSLIDKALAGEEVIITRHGKPTVSLNVVGPSESPPSPDVRDATAQLRARLAAIPQMVNKGRPLMEQIKDEYKF
jgi:antitoxin (DNA-binding transcriptional repressor) of toxin-antitoxin stability system